MMYKCTVCEYASTRAASAAFRESHYRIMHPTQYSLLVGLASVHTQKRKCPQEDTSDPLSDIGERRLLGNNRLRFRLRVWYLRNNRLCFLILVNVE